MGNVVLSVSGGRTVKSWTMKGKRKFRSILYVPNNRNDKAYIRLSAGIEKKYHTDSKRIRADRYVWVAIVWIVEYRDWWFLESCSETVNHRMATRLMNEWVDFIDNGETTREQREERKEFFAACKNGKLSLVAKMLQAGACPNFSYRGCTPLGIAVEHENMRLVRNLVAAGAEINLFYSDWTAVHAASAFGCGRILEYLLENGGEPTLRDLTYKAKTPMQYAQENEQKAAIRVLRRFGVTSDEEA